VEEILKILAAVVRVEISGGGIHPTAEVIGLSAAFICNLRFVNADDVLWLREQYS
jgi:hypothetical protein